MLQYDLTNTRIFDPDVRLPTQAEMSVISLALMLVKDVSYAELEGAEIELDRSMPESVATCIERHMPIFTQDVGVGQELRRRLEDFAGMRIVGVPSQKESRAPT